MAKKLTDKEFITSMSDGNSLFGNFGGAVGQITLGNLRAALNKNDEEALEALAFYIDVNKASSLGSAQVDVGGNMHMRALWEDAAVDVLMDKNGNYCELNPNDCRYTKEGEAVVDTTTNEVLAKWANCDFMRIIPQHYGKVQVVTIGATTIERLWLSLVPLPSGYIIPQQVVAKFKASNVGSAMRSLPNKTPDNSKTINAFWNLAQARSKNHGLANLDYFNTLLYHMMAKYAYRDAQNCVGSDGTKVWGVGLDGTESKTASDKFAAQRYITTGKTLSLGRNDGNLATTDANSEVVHCVNVWGFENPYGQYWEFVQGLCSVGTNVFNWRSNVMPTGNPTEGTFANIDHVVLQRHNASLSGSDTVKMNIITSAQGQGVYMIPCGQVSGVTYNDYFSYDANGQLWLWGGSSGNGAYCGLACSRSNHVWSASSSYVSARLAYYGQVNKVTATRLAELAAA